MNDEREEGKSQESLWSPRSRTQVRTVQRYELLMANDSLPERGPSSSPSGIFPKEEVLPISKSATGAFQKRDRDLNVRRASACSFLAKQLCSANHDPLYRLNGFTQGKHSSGKACRSMRKSLEAAVQTGKLSSSPFLLREEGESTHFQDSVLQVLAFPGGSVSRTR